GPDPQGDPTLLAPAGSRAGGAGRAAGEQCQRTCRRAEAERGTTGETGMRHGERLSMGTAGGGGTAGGAGCAVGVGGQGTTRGWEGCACARAVSSSAQARRWWRASSASCGSEGVRVGPTAAAARAVAERAADRCAARTTPRCCSSCSASPRPGGRPAMRSPPCTTPRPSARRGTSTMNGDPRALAVEKLLSATAVLLDFNGTLSLDEGLLEDCYARALAALDLAPL